MQIIEFPSTKAAWHFVVDAQEKGFHAQIPQRTHILPKVTAWAVVIGAIIGGAILGTIGGLAEGGWLGLPRLEPLLAAPIGAPTALLATIGGSIGALIGGFVGLKPVPSLAQQGTAEVVVDDEQQEAVPQLEMLAHQYHGHLNGHQGEQPRSRQMAHDDTEMPKQHAQGGNSSMNRILAWALMVIVAGILLEATSYIWYLSLAYGHGSDQDSRIGYTMKNVQRIPADTPEAAGAALATILGGTTLGVPADPIAAAMAAPLAAAQGETLVYGGGDSAVNLDLLEQLVARTDIAVVIAEDEPAYALPAAYAAALFRVPVVPLEQVADVFPQGADRLLLVAAPDRLISDDRLQTLAQYGDVERVASDNIYQHALVWARGRWGDFGWGIDEREQYDGYYYFTLANPADPAFAAAGLPAAYLGNFGPLLYTPHDDLDELTDQYLWRIAPDYFAIPSDGPFMNVRVVGGPESVSYAAQARADLALETHAYRNRVTGMSGTAVAGWMWFFPGLIGFIWALFAMPRRLPDSGFYARLYWPIAMLVLGPLGILAFYMVYQGRPVEQSGHMPQFVRPLWAQAVSATIMGMGMGMALMIASMYLFEYYGLPILTALEYTPFQWLGAPMDAWMWVLMVVPAIILSTFLFMGPMMAEMKMKPYWQGVRMAAPVVIYSMVASSVGMFLYSYWVMNWEEQMAQEDLWLWVSPLWLAAAVGFFTALIPNYWMVRAGKKMGDM